jgi:hypothetical protein
MPSTVAVAAAIAVPVALDAAPEAPGFMALLEPGRTVRVPAPIRPHHGYANVTSYKWRVGVLAAQRESETFVRWGQMVTLDGDKLVNHHRRPILFAAWLEDQDGDRQPDA